MGWLKKLGQVWSVTKQVAPILPIPQKVKVVIQKGGEVEDDIKEIVREVKPPKPAA